MPQTMLQALNISRRGGTTVFIGIPKLDAIVALTGFQLQAEGKRLMGSLFGSANVRRDFPRLIELAETGRLHLESMVSRHFKLDDVNQAFHELEAGTVVRGVLC